MGFENESYPLYIVSQDTLNSWFIRGRLTDEQISEEMQRTNPDLYNWLDSRAHTAPIVVQPLYGPILAEYESRQSTIHRVRKTTLDMYDAETRDTVDMDDLTVAWNQISSEQPVLCPSLKELIMSFGRGSERAQSYMVCMADVWTLLRRQAVLDRNSGNQISYEGVTQEQVELFKNWMNELEESYRGINKDWEEWIDSDRLLSVHREANGYVARTYHSLENPDETPPFQPSSQLSWSENGDRIYLARWDQPFQGIKYSKKFGLDLEASTGGGYIKVHYDNAGKMTRLVFGVFDSSNPVNPINSPRNFFTFIDHTDNGIVRQLYSPDGKFSLVDDMADDGFVECYDRSSDTVEILKVPKRTDIKAGLGELMPEELQRDPYHARLELDDGWRHGDLLAAFGIEREQEN